MLLAELEKRLDEIAWHEQVEHELSERPASVSQPDLKSVEALLREISTSVDVSLLDSLERDEGYLVWALRLSPFVDPTNTARRSQRYFAHPSWRVRYWARAIAGPQT